jgi:hydroxymethylpyrimidine/phosphomethylpyrimidine kinase
MQPLLTIAGYDPSSGAGITADLMVFAAHGLFGTSCITALTVQSTMGVKSIHPIETKILRANLDCLDEDLPPLGIKIGMLGSAGAVEEVADYLMRIRARHPRIPVVLDPVLRSSSGRELLSMEGVTVMKSRLLPLVDWVTPNLSELNVLSGHSTEGREEVYAAARILAREHPGVTVFATGGHLDPPDDLLVTPQGEAVWLPGERVETMSTHGTGCAL